MCLAQPATAQHAKTPFARPDTSINKLKLSLVGAGVPVIYGGTLLMLNHYWYKDYPRSSFHFFNDGKEWMGIDKAGHVFTAYHKSRWIAGMLRWSGVKRNKAAWIGGVSATVLQSSIEVLDGFSTKWGASGYDIIANATGPALFVGQELLWQEQRITLKISAFPQKYPADVKERAKDLFGSSPFELFLKDYNAITTWITVSPGSFIRHDTKFPKWLCVSAGYGANGLYGGFENKWCTDAHTDPNDCDPAHLIDRTDIRRYPQFYLSLDIDLTKIPTRSPVLKSIFNLISWVKIPFPAVEFNPVDKVKFHPMFF